MSQEIMPENEGGFFRREFTVYGRETREVVNEIKAWAKDNNAVVAEIDSDWFNVLIRAPWCPISEMIIQTLEVVVVGQAERGVDVGIGTYLFDLRTNDIIEITSIDVDPTQGIRVRDELVSRLAALSAGGMQPQPYSQQTQPAATVAQVQPSTLSQSGAAAYPPQAVQGSPHSPSARGSAFCCSSCGREASERWEFCRWCGSQMKNTPERPEPAQEKRLCASCGSELSELVNFCTSCGAPVGRTPERIGYVHSQVETRPPPVSQQGPEQFRPYSPPPPMHPNVAPQGSGQVREKKGWLREHLSGTYHCPKCSWSGTKGDMDESWTFIPSSYPIPLDYGTGSVRQFKYVPCYEVYYKYKCPKCHELLKKKTQVMPSLPKK